MFLISALFGLFFLNHAFVSLQWTLETDLGRGFCAAPPAHLRGAGPPPDWARGARGVHPKVCWPLAAQTTLSTKFHSIWLQKLQGYILKILILRWLFENLISCTLQRKSKEGELCGRSHLGLGWFQTRDSCWMEGEGEMAGGIFQEP